MATFTPSYWSFSTGYFETKYRFRWSRSAPGSSRKPSVLLSRSADRIQHLTGSDHVGASIPGSDRACSRPGAMLLALRAAVTLDRTLLRTGRGDQARTVAFEIFRDL